MINTQEIKNKLFDKIKDTTWGQKLKYFVMSSYFDDVLDSLIFRSVDLKKKFTPQIKDLFMPFESCSYEDVSVVILYPEPAVEIYKSNGLALSFDNESFKLNKCVPYHNALLLQSIHNVRIGDKKFNYNLLPWAKQGVFLYNTTLTSMIDKKVSSHKEIWAEFTYAVIELLNRMDKDLVILMFNETQDYEGLFDNRHEIINIDFPTVKEFVPYAEIVAKFDLVNEKLKKKGRKEIVWKQDKIKI